jgi:hypothetical protein
LLPFNLYPFVGMLIKAWLKALGTGEYLHIKVNSLSSSETSVHDYYLQYFDAKKMTPHQRAVFVEENKWEYRSEQIKRTIAYFI